MTSKSGSLIARNKKNIREFFQYLDGVMGVLQWDADQGTADAFS
ncbi:MAG: hypothetical protein V3R62_01805 [Acidiferrobacterales bacterium]